LTSDHFFVPKDGIAWPKAVIEGDQHRHLSVVVRFRVGDEIRIFDESGARYRGRIEAVEKERTILGLLEILPGSAEPHVKVVLAQAMLKPKAMDFIIQKATELGAAGIIPVRAVRSVARVDGRWDGKAARWTRIAREAAKQSRRSSLPWIGRPRPVDQLGDASGEGEARFVLSENVGLPLKTRLLETLETGLPASALIAVGPEGGWTESELESLRARGFRPVSLCDRILRAETASLVAIALIDHLWNL